MGLSLRDIEYGIRLLALLARNIPAGAFTHPFLLAVLIAMKFKNPKFYHGLVRGQFRTSEIMDYIADAVPQESLKFDLTYDLDRIEGFLYCADNANGGSQEAGGQAYAELHKALQSGTEDVFHIISRRAQNADKQQLYQILRAIADGRDLRIDSKVLGNLAALIDTYQTQLRR